MPLRNGQQQNGLAEAHSALVPSCESDILHKASSWVPIVIHNISYARHQRTGGCEYTDLISTHALLRSLVRRISSSSSVIGESTIRISRLARSCQGQARAQVMAGSVTL